MSVNAIIPEVWSALVKEELERAVPWLQVVEDLSAEISQGNQVHIPQIITSFDGDQQAQAGTSGAQPSSNAPAIGNYSRDGALTYGLTQAADITLDLDQEKTWAFRIDDLDQLQTRPDLMQRNVGRAMRAMGRTINDRIRGSFISSSSSTKRANSAATPVYAAIALANANIYETEVSKTGAARAGSDLNGVDLDNLFNRTHDDYFKLAQAFITMMMRAKEHADENYWPEERRYCMMGPQAKNRIIEYITDQKPNLGAGMVIDEAFVNGNAPGKIFGFEGIVDPGIPALRAADAANDKHGRMYFGLKNDGLAFAAQVQKVEALRLQTHFADAMRGLYVYGSGWLLTDRGFYSQFDVKA